jgi:hypothetical protein
LAQEELRAVDLDGDGVPDIIVKHQNGDIYVSIKKVAAVVAALLTAAAGILGYVL